MNGSRIGGYGRVLAIAVSGVVLSAALSGAVSAAAAGATSSKAAHGSWKNSVCRTDVATVQTAVDAFRNDTLVYPNGTGPGNDGGAASTIVGQAVDFSALVPTYLHSVPASNERFVFANSAGAVESFLNGHKKPCASTIGG